MLGLEQNSIAASFSQAKTVARVYDEFAATPRICGGTLSRGLQIAERSGDSRYSTDSVHGIFGQSNVKDLRQPAGYENTLPA